MFDKVTKNIPLLTFALVAISYAFQQAEYASFNIDILHYFTITDFLLSLLPVLTVLTIFFGLYPTILSYLTKSPEKDVVNKLFEVASNKYYIIGLVVLFVVMIFLPSHLMFQGYYLIYMFCWANYFFWIYEKVYKSITGSYAFQIRVVIVVLGMVAISSIGGAQKSQELRKFGRGNLCFKRNDITTCTHDSMLFIGQTSNYIFLFDSKQASTHVIKLEQVDSLIFKGADETIIDKAVK